MTEPVSSPILQAVRPIQDELAGVLGVATSEVIGVPLAIAFLVRIDEPGRCFLGGLSHDVASAAVESLGGHVVPDGADRPSAGAAILTVAPEVWSRRDPGPAFGFGPVALAPTADPALFTNYRRLRVVIGRAPERSRLESAERVRATFSLVSDRLADEVAPSVDWSMLTRAEGAAEAWKVEALGAMAATRSAVGSYLIGLADTLDDERIDQLGDGYVRAAELWRILASGDWKLGPDLHELERCCVNWMRSASNRPTRYAF